MADNTDEEYLENPEGHAGRFEGDETKPKIKAC